MQDLPDNNHVSPFEAVVGLNIFESEMLIVDNITRLLGQELGSV